MFRFPVDYIAITQGFHNGYALDFGWYNHKYQTIYACGSGKVLKTEYQKTGGLTIFILHDNGYVSCYGHLNRIDVKKGQKIKLGQAIGIMGESGIVTAQHLHFQINSSDKNIYGKGDINPFDICLVYPMQKVCQSGNTKNYLSMFKYLDDRNIWEVGTYRLLYEKAIRKTHELTNNIVKVGNCDKGTQQYLTSKNPNANAFFKKGTDVIISDIYTQGKRVWGAYGNCWLVLCNIDGTKQALKIK